GDFSGHERLRRRSQVPHRFLGRAAAQGAHGRSGGGPRRIGCVGAAPLRLSLSHVDEVIPLMAEGRVLPYIDVPFQHASPRILKLMKRPASGEDNLARIRAWRTICPDVTIRSTFIAGFPGETEDEFRELLDFLEAAELDRVGCFAYSPVQGAKANELPGALSNEVREERRERLM